MIKVKTVWLKRHSPITIDGVRQLPPAAFAEPKFTVTPNDHTRDNAPLELEFPGTESECSYLPQQRATMTYRLAYELSAARYEQLLSRGWRRFGRTLFRPVCATCRACRSVRVRLPEFTPSKSQRRTLKNNPGVEIVVSRPGLTDEHIDLYNRYHMDMHMRRQWPVRSTTPEEYFGSFLDGKFSFSREFQYRKDGRLIGLGLVDMTSNVMSSIYFFHDPAWRDNAPGTFSILSEIAEGQKSGKAWLYLGYYIRDCQSMNYKNRFHPHEFLESYPPDDQEPRWCPPESASSAPE